MERNTTPQSLDISIVVGKPVAVKYTYPDGSVIDGLVDVDDLKNVFGTIQRGRATLPKMCTDFRVLSYVALSDKHECLIAEPPQVWPITYTGFKDSVVKPIPIKFPWIIAHCFMDANLYPNACSIYLTDNNPYEAIMNEQPISIYHMPTNNIYSDNGYVCWGDKATPIKNPGEAMHLINNFMCSPFNTHLMNMKYIIDGESVNWAMVLEKARSVQSYVIETKYCKLFGSMSISKTLPRVVKYTRS